MSLHVDRFLYSQLLYCNHILCMYMYPSKLTVEHTVLTYDKVMLLNSMKPPMHKMIFSGTFLPLMQLVQYYSI